MRTQWSNPVDPPIGSHAGVLSHLVSLSTQRSKKNMGSPFPPVFSYSRKYHKSFCGRIKRVTTVYTYCSILGSFLISQHLHQLMDSGCENWLGSGNRVRDCDFPSQWLTSASYSLVLVVCCCITNDHKLRSLKQNVFYYLTFFMGQKFRHILAESST